MKPILEDLSVLKNLPDALVYLQQIKDSLHHPMDFFIQYANPAFEALVGRTMDSIMGQPITKVLPQTCISDQERIETYNQINCTGEPIKRWEFFSGKNCWYHHLSYPVRPGYLLSIFQDIQERGRGEGATLPEKRYQKLFEGSRDGLVVVNIQGKIIEANPAFCNMLGYDLQELKELENFYYITPKKWWQWEQEEIWEKRLLCSGYSGIYQKEYIRKDGSHFPVELQSFAIQDKKNNIAYLWGVARDITSRKKAQEQLEKSERNYREIFNSVKDAIFIHHMKSGAIVDVNKAALNLYGCNDKTEIIHYMESFTDVAGGYTIKKLQEMIQAARLVKTKTFEWQAKMKNGKIFWVEVSLKRTTIDGKERILAVVRDIQERKEREEALRESEERFRRFAESAPIGIVISDQREKTLYVNKKFSQLFGYTIKDIPSVKHWWPLAYPDETLRTLVQKTWQQAIKTAKRDLEIKPLEYPVHCKDGTVRQIEFRLSSLGDLHVVTFVDITQRKQQEEKEALYTQQLEQLYQQQDKEMEKARKIHQLLLPKILPKVKGITAAAYNQPARKIGGDFYDLIQTENHLVFYLSDVSGHGLDSAMLSFFVKHTIRGYLNFASSQSISPVNILQYLAHQFQQENYPEEYFICIFLASICLETMTMTYAGAGFQDTPLIKFGDGKLHQLKSRGFFITSFYPLEIKRIKEKSILLTPNTTLFFNTDGLTEQRVNGQSYGSRLPEVFYRHAHLPPKYISQVIRNDFSQFNQGQKQGVDDITFLILQIEPEGKKSLNMRLDSTFD